MTVKIGLVQMLCEKGAIEQNLQAIKGYVDQAITLNLDFLCFPEMSITGYINPEQDRKAVLSLVSPEVARFVEMSANHRITLIAGIVEANPPGKPFITQLVAQAGQLLGYYRKAIIEAEEAGLFAPGQGIVTFHHPKISFGLAICADIESPEVFRENAQAGAKLIFEAAAPGLYGSQSERNWQTGYRWWKDKCQAQLGRYSLGNKVYIAVATQAGRTKDEDFPGGGYLFGPDGTCLAATKDYTPGLLCVTLPEES
jgi:predicted amidohydrolase